MAKYDWRKRYDFREDLAMSGSGGEERRIKIVRTAMRDRANVLILDEPYRNPNTDVIHPLIFWNATALGEWMYGERKELNKSYRLERREPVVSKG